MPVTRLATPSDIPSILPVVNTAFAIETFLEGERTDQARLIQMMETGDILIAEGDEKTIAACIYVTVRGPRGHFGMLAVDPKHQGNGLGRVMATAAEDYFRQHGCDSIEIDVLSLRPDLPPFYRRLGYSEIGTHPAPLVRALKPGLECHAIIMAKTL